MGNTDTDNSKLVKKPVKEVPVFTSPEEQSTYRRKNSKQAGGFQYDNFDKYMGNLDEDRKFNNEMEFLTNDMDTGEPGKYKSQEDYNTQKIGMASRIKDLETKGFLRKSAAGYYISDPAARKELESDTLFKNTLNELNKFSLTYNALDYLADENIPEEKEAVAKIADKQSKTPDIAEETVEALMSTTDEIYIGASAADLTSAVLSLVPGANLVSTGVGIAASTANLTADIMNEDVSGLEAAGNYTFSLALDALSVIPVVGKSAKVARIVTKVAPLLKRVMPGVKTALMAYGAKAGYESISEFSGVMEKDMDEWDTMDYVKALQAATFAVGISKTGGRMANSYAANKWSSKVSTTPNRSIDLSQKALPPGPAAPITPAKPAAPGTLYPGNQLPNGQKSLPPSSQKQIGSQSVYDAQGNVNKQYSLAPKPTSAVKPAPQPKPQPAPQPKLQPKSAPTKINNDPTKVFTPREGVGKIRTYIGDKAKGMQGTYTKYENAASLKADAKFAKASKLTGKPYASLDDIKAQGKKVYGKNAPVVDARKPVKEAQKDLSGKKDTSNKNLDDLNKKNAARKKATADADVAEKATEGPLAEQRKASTDAVKAENKAVKAEGLARKSEKRLNDARKAAKDNINLDASSDLNKKLNKRKKKNAVVRKYADEQKANQKIARKNADKADAAVKDVTDSFEKSKISRDAAIKSANDSAQEALKGRKVVGDSRTKLNKKQGKLDAKKAEYDTEKQKHQALKDSRKMDEYKSKLQAADEGVKSAQKAKDKAVKSGTDSEIKVAESKLSKAQAELDKQSSGYRKILNGIGKRFNWSQEKVVKAIEWSSKWSPTGSHMGHIKIGERKENLTRDRVDKGSAMTQQQFNAYGDAIKRAKNYKKKKVEKKAMGGKLMKRRYQMFQHSNSIPELKPQLSPGLTADIGKSTVPKFSVDQLVEKLGSEINGIDWFSLPNSWSKATGIGRDDDRVGELAKMINNLTHDEFIDFSSKYKEAYGEDPRQALKGEVSKNDLDVRSNAFSDMEAGWLTATYDQVSRDGKAISPTYDIMGKSQGNVVTSDGTDGAAAGTVHFGEDPKPEETVVDETIVEPPRDCGEGATWDNVLKDCISDEEDEPDTSNIEFDDTLEEISIEDDEFFDEEAESIAPIYKGGENHFWSDVASGAAAFPLASLYNMATLNRPTKEYNVPFEPTQAVTLNKRTVKNMAGYEQSKADAAKPVYNMKTNDLMAKSTLQKRNSDIANQRKTQLTVQNAAKVEGDINANQQIEKLNRKELGTNRKENTLRKHSLELKNAEMQAAQDTAEQGRKDAIVGNFLGNVGNTTKAVLSKRKTNQYTDQLAQEGHFNKWRASNPDMGDKDARDAYYAMNGVNVGDEDWDRSKAAYEHKMREARKRYKDSEYRTSSV